MPIHGYPGNIITANPTAPTSSVASGVWTTEQQLQAKAAGNWPFTIPTQQISRSLRFNSADSAYLNRTFGSAGNLQTWTWSAWIKRSGFVNDPQRLFYTGNSNNNETSIYFSADRLAFEYYVAPTNYYVVSSAVFRDPSAWYHFVVVSDTTNATSSDRMRIYVNGSRITNFAISSYPAQNANLTINSAAAHYIGRRSDGSNSFDGYFTEINFIDGQALTPSSFGQTNASTGVWEPIAYSGTYGTNGFYVNFSDNSGTTSTTLGKDYSGNGNNWTPNNFSVTAGVGNDSLVDTPTSYGTDTGVGGEVRGNYCTANAVDLGSVAAPTNGNLAQTLSGTNGTGASGTFTVTTGKWYWEVTSNATTNAAQYVGVIRGALPSTAGPTTNPSGFYYGASGNNREDGTTVTYGNSWTNLGVDYVIGVALDCDANTVVFYVNNVSQGTRNLPSTTSGWKPQLGFNSSSGSAVMNYNFGQRAFAYTAPSGFKALCTQNLPTPTIGATSTTQANDYFNAVLYTGTGSSLGVTGVGFQPDLVWIKSRSAATDHGWYDAVRGVQKQLESNTLTAETTETTGLTAFGTDGFTVGALAQLNTSSATYVAWNWKANGAGGSNTAGTITSTVSANTTSGFSIATFTQLSGSPYVGTVGHGLGVAPSMVIIKDRSIANGWLVYHASLGATQYLVLSSTAAAATGSNAFNNTAPTSTVFTTAAGSTYWGNAGATAVAYCFAPVAGYSAFGSFTGNGSTDGPFVYLGFRPRWVLIKSSSAVTNWWVWDTARNTYNVMNTVLYPDLSNAEYSDSSTFLMDDLSNGFKYRTSNSTVNGSGTTYIYAAFAESPFKYSLAR